MLRRTDQGEKFHVMSQFAWSESSGQRPTSNTSAASGVSVTAVLGAITFDPGNSRDVDAKSLALCSFPKELERPLRSILVSQVSSPLALADVDAHASVADIILLLETAENVLVDNRSSNTEDLEYGGSRSCQILGRMQLLRSAMEAHTVKQQLSFTLGSKQRVSFLADNDTLETALRAMLSSGCEVLGVANDSGNLTSVITCHDILCHLRRYVSMHCKAGPGTLRSEETLPRPSSRRRPAAVPSDVM